MSLPTIPMQDAETDGQNAAWDGKPNTACPQEGFWYRYAWMRGWYSVSADALHIAPNLKGLTP